jgi:hypothetical protein
MAEPDPLSNAAVHSSAVLPLRQDQSTHERASDTENRIVSSVPNVFFEGSFNIEDTATFHTACPIEDIGEEACIRNLEGHLDKVFCLLLRIALYCIFLCMSTLEHKLIPVGGLTL